MLKRLLIIWISLLSFGHASAQDTCAPAPPAKTILSKKPTLTPAERLEDLRAELKYYRGMKASGAGITAVGVTFFAVGQGLFWSSVALNQSGKRNYAPTARDPLWLAGLGTTLLSSVPFAFGIPLLRYGSIKVRELKKKLPKQQLLQ